MSQKNYEIKDDTYKVCTGCVNLLRGSFYGKPWIACGGGIDNPLNCIIVKHREANKKAKKLATNSIKRRRKPMKKETYKEELKKVVGKRLRELRTEMGLSQEKLAVALKGKILQAAISQYERFKALPTVKRIGIFAKFFKVSPEYIYGYTDNRKRTLWQKLFCWTKGGK